MDYPINLVPLLSYAVSYTEAVCDTFFEKNETVGGKDLASFTPVKQINAFLVRSVFETWQAEAAQFQSPFFNYGSAEVKEKFNALMKSLSSNVTIDRDNFEPMLEKAVIDTLRLIFRPTETLLQYLEKLDKQVPIDRLLKPQLKYLKLHPKFIKAIHEEFAEVDEVKRKKLLKRVEEMAKDGHLFDLPYEAMQAFNQTLPLRIGEIVPNWSNSTDEDEHDAVLYASSAMLSRSMSAEEAAIALGFEEKSAHYDEEDYHPEDPELALYSEEDMLSEEEIIGDERPITEADMKGLPTKEELEVIAKDASPIASPVAATIADDQTSIANLFRNEPSLDDILEESPTAISHEPHVERVSFTESQASIQEEVPAPLEEEASTEGISPEEDAPKSLLQKLKDAQQAAKKEAEEVEESANVYKNIARNPSNTIKIKGTIPLNLKFRYLNDLFEGNASLFEEAIDFIDESPDYHSAIAVIKDRYIRKYGWDLGDDTTREFLSMISRKFE